jgi:carboxypeptidase C (cathepsin A)
MRTNRMMIAGLAVMLAAFGASAQGRRGATTDTEQAPQQRSGRGGQPGAQQPNQPQQGTETQQRRVPPPEEKTSVTHHTARIGGQELKYTATAAQYVIKDDEGNPKTTFFFVAYTKDDVADVSKRPIAFSYNGGPGSASLFVHLGFGPRRVVLAPDGHGNPAPYSIRDNDESVLDATDVVFVDAVSTGFSRPAPAENPAQFHGLIEDATYFSDFIYQFITRTERWASPKFLIGESYGTTRSAQLASTLQQRHQMYLSGIVLVSAVLNFTTLQPTPGNDLPPLVFLPTYATTAWYHKMLPPDLQSLSVEQVAQKAREFADGEYAAALMKGDQLTGAEKDKVVKDIARFTALSTKYIEEINLRINAGRWFKELERGKRRTVGRLDSRFEGIDADAAGERNEYDPSEASYEGAYVAAFQDYARRELKWETEGYYAVSGNVRPWNQTAYPQVPEALRSAMTQQGFLKVLVVCGYYDVATVFHGIEYTVDHMGLEPPIRKNISFSYYESGHMVYIDDKARSKLHRDIANFINSSFAH